MSEKKNPDEITQTTEVKNEIRSKELLKRLDAAVNEKKADITSTEVTLLTNGSSSTQNSNGSEKREDDKTSEKDESEKKAFETFLKIALIVFVIALIIITVGWLFSKLNKPEYEDAVIIEDEDELDLKKDRLKEVEGKIAPLELKKAQIQKTEKRFLIAARIVIGFTMLAVNGWFANKYIYFDNTFELNKILSFNSAILLCYSFIAFVSHGTPSNFVAALKNIISNYLKRKHIDTLTELEKLVKEREQLVVEIEILEKSK